MYSYLFRVIGSLVAFRQYTVTVMLSAITCTRYSVAVVAWSQNVEACVSAHLALSRRY